MSTLGITGPCVSSHSVEAAFRRGPIARDMSEKFGNVAHPGAHFSTCFFGGGGEGGGGPVSSASYTSCESLTDMGEFRFINERNMNREGRKLDSFECDTSFKQRHGTPEDAWRPRGIPSTYINTSPDSYVVCGTKEMMLKTAHTYPVSNPQGSRSDLVCPFGALLP